MSVAAPGLPGDFNLDGSVDAADYVLWRSNPGGVYTQADYDDWLANFGQTAGSGSSASIVAVPEPACAGLLAVLAIFGSSLGRPRRRSSSGRCSSR